MKQKERQIDINSQGMKLYYQERQRERIVQKDRHTQIDIGTYTQIDRKRYNRWKVKD